MRPRLALLALLATPMSAIAAGEPQPAASGHWSHVPVGTAPTPPMGWNSWNAFGVNITEARILGSARVIRDGGLAALGYRSINIDDGWWHHRRLSDGRLQVRTNLFPSAAIGGPEATSLRPLVDRLHAMGFKAGIYTDIGRNACSQAWSPDNPNLPEGTQAEREVGLYGHAAQDIRLYFGDWRFDYIKVDACGLSAYKPGHPKVADGTFRAFPPLIVDANVDQSDIPAVQRLYGEVRDALARVRPARDYVLSLCNWGSANVRAWGKDYGTMWRTSNDIDPTWGRMLHNFDSVATRELYAGPGRWNDPDMLEVGNGAFDGDHLTEARAHMSLWAIAAAPLIIGTDLTRAPPAILDILRAPEVIAVDQDQAGNQGVLAYSDSERQIIVKSLTRRGEKAVVLVNRTEIPTEMTLTAAHLKLASDRPIALRDLWRRADLAGFTGQTRFRLGPHEALLLKATGMPALADGWLLSEQPARINVAADGIRHLAADPMIHRMMDPYHPSTTGDGLHPIYAGWGGPRADSTPFGEPLRVANVDHRYGIGTLVGARLEVATDRKAKRFSADVGVDDSSGDQAATVVFEVWGDGRRVARSRPKRFNEPAEHLEADVSGKTTVELVSRATGPADARLAVDWANARLLSR